MSKKISVGKQLKATRKALGLNQTDFGMLIGKLTGTTLSQDQISRLEAGQTRLLFPKAVMTVLNAELDRRRMHRMD